MLPVMAIIFAIMFPLAGLIIALIDRSNTEKQGKKMNTLTQAALIISIIRVALSIVLLIVSFLANFYR